MSRFDEQREARRIKRAEMVDAGISPYPARSRRTHSCADAAAGFDQLATGKKAITLAGRIRALRPHGGTTFIELEDGSGFFQVVFSRDALGQSGYSTLMKSLDLGDFVETAGSLIRTKRGQPTLAATSGRLLAKALRPLPEKYYGLKDTETRLRHRYLDLLMNPDVRELFQKKTVFWSTVRSFLVKAGFLEVETPVFESVPGGAEAEPFITHHNALDQEVTLRISLELPLKRLLVGGFEKVFEIGRIFRNEGISAEHLQDYTQMEFYWAYADYHDLMDFLPTFYREVLKATAGDLRIAYAGKTVDWGAPWMRYDYYEVFSKHTGLDLRGADEVDLKKTAERLGCSVADYAQRGRLIDAIYKKAVRPHLLNPGFLLDPPVEVEPLAKRREDDPSKVERLQVVAWGSELGKGFSELNDPVDQRERFEEQMRLRTAGDKEAQQLDEDFLAALEYGMPPAAGFGMSERLFAFCSDRPVREAVLFPPMKHQKGSANHA